MGRILFPRGKQKEFIIDILQNNLLCSKSLAKVTGVSERTIRDWREERSTLSEEAVKLWIKKFKVPFPNNVKTLSNYWYVFKGARTGALKRLALYGPPGTIEGRIKGGHISQIKRKLNPELYRNCIQRKKFSLPTYSEDLAELIGIILGDGGITKEQLVITLNNMCEVEYIKYVFNLLEKTLGEKPRKYLSNTKFGQICDIVISGVGLVEILSKLELHYGNKVARQVTVPKWVISDSSFSKRCLRGLVDTDGCVYLHRHHTHKNYCLNIGMTFTSHSRPLLDFVYKTLVFEGFNPKIQGDDVRLYRGIEVIKYADKIGFSNTHHVSRLSQFLKLKNGGVA